MRLNNLIMKKIYLIASIAVILSLQMFLSSCSSSATTTTKQGAWDKVSSFDGRVRSNAISFVINGVPYMGMGYNSGLNIRLSDFYRYDAENDTWFGVADFPGAARTNAVAFVLNNKGYVGTGYDDNQNVLSDFWQYDPAVGQGGTWTKVADFGYSASHATPAIQRYQALGFSIGGRGFVGGGQDKSGSAFKDFWEYLPTTNEWVKRASMGGAKRRNPFVMIIDNFAYIGGGYDPGSGTYPTDFWKFDVSKVDSGNPWIALDALDQRDNLGNTKSEPKSREQAGAFVIAGKGYITAGSLGYAQGDTWQYDPTKDTWTEFYSLNTEASNRYAAIGFAVGNYGYITTGSNGSQQFDDVWKFDPTGTEPNYK
jgi:hypothetical protein